MNAFMVGVMHEWVQRPDAYDLAQAAPAMIDSLLAGLAARPPMCAPRRRARQHVAARKAGRQTAAGT
jgi:hypothetical protein